MRALVAAVAAVLVLGGCHVAGTAKPDRATSACLNLGGTVGSGDSCEIHSATATYTISMRFPTDYPDQDAIADFLTQRRKDFIDWVDAAGQVRTMPAALDVIGKAYRSGNDGGGTRSLVLSLGEDTGVHPVTTYKAFNYSLAAHVPITFDTLFKPGSNPVAVLKPFVAQQALARDRKAGKAVDDLTADSYQQFAITDDAIIFFFNQDGLLPHEVGPFEVTVPRSALASILA
ncbi:MAG: esterase [Mycobacterium sp.]